MIFSKKQKTIVYIDDEYIRYLRLAKNNYGFYVEKHGAIKIEPGTINHGEILHAAYLKNTLQNLVKKISDIGTDIELLLPHDLFLFDLHRIQKEKKKVSAKKILKQHLDKNKKTISWAATHSYEYDLFDFEENISVLFRALPRDVYAAYEHIFKQVGLKINSTHSNILSFAHLLPQNGQVNQVFVQNNTSSILDYVDGIYTAEKKLTFSRNQCLSEIKKNIGSNDEQAIKILNNYGITRSHRDEQVFKVLDKNAHSITDYLEKKQADFRKNNSDKIEKSFPIYIHFDGLPIKGFLDKCAKGIKTDVLLLSTLSGKYTFQDILAIHKRDSYTYEALIARALAVFKK